jgi:hypothetical protein
MYHRTIAAQKKQMRSWQRCPSKDHQDTMKKADHVISMSIKIFPASPLPKPWTWIPCHFNQARRKIKHPTAQLNRQRVPSQATDGSSVCATMSQILVAPVPRGPKV